MNLPWQPQPGEVWAVKINDKPTTIKLIEIRDEGWRRVVIYDGFKKRTEHMAPPPYGVHDSNVIWLHRTQGHEHDEA